MAVPDAEKFQYPMLPIDTANDKYFRVLTLRPKQDGDAITIDLETCQTSTVQRYEALSYCWGDPTASEIVYVSGLAFEVTLNLHTALKHLRHDHKARRMWIDAVCIDQDNPQERARQVTMMRDIYRMAFQVVVWLGPEADESDRIIKFHRKIVAQYGNDYCQKESGYDIQAMVREALEKAPSHQAPQDTSQALVDEEQSASYKDTQPTRGQMPSHEGCGYEVDQTPDLLPATSTSDAKVDAAQTKKSRSMIDTPETTTEGDADSKSSDQARIAGTSQARRLGILSVVLERMKKAFFFRQARHDNRAANVSESNSSQEHDDSESYDSELSLTSAHGPYTHALRLVANQSGRINKQVKDMDLPEEELASLIKLYRRPWFGRIWVVQEVAVARRCIVQCGQSRIDWVIFYLGIVLLALMSPLVNAEHGVRRIVEAIELQQNTSTVGEADYDATVVEPLRLLRTYRPYQATDARDKIYALMGMMDPGVKNWNFTIDYIRTFEETYRSFAISHMQCFGKLHVISMSRSLDRSGNLPSWVADWRDTSTQPWALVGSFITDEQWSETRATRRFVASGDSSCTPQVHDLTQLHLEGYAIDSIKTLGDVMIDPGMMRQVMDDYAYDVSDEEAALTLIGRMFDILKCSEIIKGWEKMAGVRDPRRGRWGIRTAARDGNLQAYTRTLLADIDTSDIGQACHNFRRAMYEVSEVLRNVRGSSTLDPRYRKTGSPLDKKTEAVVEKLSRIEYSRYLANAVGYIYGRRFFKSANGRYGLAGKYASVGDSIVLVKGGDAPLVIRRHAAHGRAFELISDAYLDGVMYGEMWDEKKCHEIVLL